MIRLEDERTPTLPGLEHPETVYRRTPRTLEVATVPYPEPTLEQLRETQWQHTVAAVRRDDRGVLGAIREYGTSLDGPAQDQLTTAQRATTQALYDTYLAHVTLGLAMTRDATQLTGLQADSTARTALESVGVAPAMRTPLLDMPDPITQTEAFTAWLALTPVLLTVDPMAADAIAGILDTSTYRAQSTLAKALHLFTGLPHLAAALQRGHVSADRVELVLRATATLDLEVQRDVDRTIAAWRPVRYPRYRDKLTQLIARITLASEKIQQQVRDERCVWISTRPDGTTTLGLTGPTLPLVGLFEAWTSRTRAAQQNPDEDRTTGQLMFDLATNTDDPAWTTPEPGHNDDSAACAHDGQDAAFGSTGYAGAAFGLTPHPGSGTRESDTRGTDDAASAFGTGRGRALGGGHGASPRVGTLHVTVPVLDLLDPDADLPGWITGHGPITADDARRLAGAAPVWRRILTDPDTGAFLDTTPQNYRIPEALRRHVARRSGTCMAPGCTHTATASTVDIDHIVPFDRDHPATGGLTVPENLQALCRFHHQAKTAGRLTATRTRDPDGQWITTWRLDGRPLADTSDTTEDPTHAHRLRDLLRDDPGSQPPGMETPAHHRTDTRRPGSHPFSTGVPDDHTFSAKVSDGHSSSGSPSSHPPDAEPPPLQETPGRHHASDPDRSRDPRNTRDPDPPPAATPEPDPPAVTPDPVARSAKATDQSCDEYPGAPPY